MCRNILTPNKLSDKNTGNDLIKNSARNRAEFVTKADFSSLNVPGTYILKVGNRESYDFVIGDDVYDVPMVQSWRSYTLSRSNTAINDDKVSGLKLEGGHKQDKEARVYFSDKLNNKGDKIDVSGGLY